MAAAYLIIADTVLYCCGRRDHPIGDGRSDGHSEAQRHSEAHSSEPVLTLSPVWEKQVFWETIFPGSGKRGEKVVKSSKTPMISYCFVISYMSSYQKIRYHVRYDIMVSGSGKKG